MSRPTPEEWRDDALADAANDLSAIRDILESINDSLMRIANKLSPETKPEKEDDE